MEIELGDDKSILIVDSLVKIGRSNFTDSELRLLVAWLWKNKPDTIRDIVREDCPEVC